MRNKVWGSEKEKWRNSGDKRKGCATGRMRSKDRSEWVRKK